MLTAAYWSIGCNLLFDNQYSFSMRKSAGLRTWLFTSTSAKHELEARLIISGAIPPLTHAFIACTRSSFLSYALTIKLPCKWLSSKTKNSPTYPVLTTSSIDLHECPVWKSVLSEQHKILLSSSVMVAVACSATMLQDCPLLVCKPQTLRVVPGFG